MIDNNILSRGIKLKKKSEESDISTEEIKGALKKAETLPHPEDTRKKLEVTLAEIANGDEPHIEKRGKCTLIKTAKNKTNTKR